MFTLADVVSCKQLYLRSYVTLMASGPIAYCFSGLVSSGFFDSTGMYLELDDMSTERRRQRDMTTQYAG